MTGTYEYDAFGAVRAQSGATTEWSYTGEENDPTGLEYLRARYYDASTGRFLSQDPMLLLQRYAYVNDNPANLVDPSGYLSVSSVAGALKDAASDVYAVAKKILDDPCWKTHMFCPHAALVWKELRSVGSVVRNAAAQASSYVNSLMDEAASAAAKAASAVGRAVKYCASSSHLFECYERYEVAAAGVIAGTAGVFLITTGCGSGAVFTAVTAGIGTPAGAAMCGVFAVGGGILIAGGGVTFYHAFTPWHEREDRNY